MESEWGPITELCDSIFADLPVLVPEIVAVIRREVPGYHVVDLVEHIAAVTDQYRGVLIGLGERRLPSPQEIDPSRELGRSRARVGLSIQSLIGAYHVGYREMWNILLTRADARDPRLVADLARLGGTASVWLQHATTAAACAYSEAVRAEDAAQLALTYRFFDVLIAGRASSADLDPLAHALGFEPAGEFQAVCAPARCWSDESLAALRTALRRSRGTVHCVNRGTIMLALIQRISLDTMIHEMNRLVPGSPIGIGLPRPGLPGAAASITDAQQVLPLAQRSGHPARFDEQWLAATVLPHAARLSALLEPCRTPAAEHPELAETIQCFARHDMSLAATGRALHVHPNTVKYRLDRWHDLTGWDVRTWDGLSRSMIGLELLAPTGAPDPIPPS
ncbi:PucR family transcriptional regulator [Nocardia sp. NPDC051570]|uniref:PucR family transcriptional regulator n=1 Tax=Nocardia sp. NPDC051570 TaxID=3364324 RepID=UPI0037A5B993